MVKPVKTIFKIESINIEYNDRMTATDFSVSFSHFKEGIRQINESKAQKWMDAKVKTEGVDI